MTQRSVDIDEPDEEMPEKVGNYRPISVLGSGGMGVVYRAVDENDQLVALKVMKGAEADDSLMQRRFMREASAGARLYHPHIVRFLDFGFDDGRYYMAMELIEGVSLWDWIPEVPDGEAVHDIIDQILSALAYAHARGVVHRDLKPENVLIERDRNGKVSARLMDFGIVHFRRESLAVHSEVEVLGTPEYISPEQALSADRVSPASDLYAVGILIWELLTGKPPYSGDNPAETIRAHLEGPRPMFVPRKQYDVSGPLESVLNRLLARDPKDRFSFARDARRAFDECEIRGGTPVDELPGADRSNREDVRKHAVKPKPGLYAIGETPYQNVRPDLKKMRDFAEGALREGQVRFIILSGRGGLGKSRLLSELGAELEEAGLMQTWTGTADATGNPIIAANEALQRGFGIFGLSREKAEPRVRDQAFRLGIDDPLEADAFVSLVLGYARSSRSGLLRSEEARLAQFSRTLARARKIRPVFLALDGIRVTETVLNTWRGFLEREELDDFCTVLAYSVDTRRKEEIDALRRFYDSIKGTRRGRQLLHINLEPLPTRALQRIIVASANVHPNVATGIASHAGGNPQTALEMVRNFSELAGMDLSADVDNVDEVLRSLPAASVELAQRKCQQILPKEEADVSWHILEILASYDSHFDLTAAQSLVTSLLEEVTDDQVEKALTAGIAAGVVTEVRSGYFRFVSGMVREALVERLSISGELSQVSRQIAEFENEQLGSKNFLKSARIAERYQLGGDDDRAQRYFMQAGKRAYEEGRLHAAREMLEKALLLTSRLKEAPSRTREASVLHALARVMIRLNRLHDAQDLLQRVPINEIPPDHRRAVIHWMIWAEWSRHQGLEDRAIRHFQKALKTAVLAGERRLEAIVRMTFSQFRLEAGHLAEAEVQARGALASGDKDNAEFQGSCMLVLGFVALYSGGIEESRYYLDAADEIFAGNASRFSLATASLLDGEIHYQRRLLHEAITAYDKSRRLLQDVGDQRSWAIVQLHRSRALISLGSLDLARKSVNSALEHLESVNNRRWASFGALIGARIEAEAQRWDLANSRLQTALSYDLRSPTHMIPFTEQLVAVARQWVFSGQYEVAEQILAQCSKKLERLGASTYLYEVADEIEYLLHVVREPESEA